MLRHKAPAWYATAPMRPALGAYLPSEAKPFSVSSLLGGRPGINRMSPLLRYGGRLPAAIPSITLCGCRPVAIVGG